MSLAAVSREQKQHFRQILTLNVLVSVIVVLLNKFPTRTYLNKSMESSSFEDELNTEVSRK